MITFQDTKELSPDLLFELYKSIGWTDDTMDSVSHGKLIADVYANSDNVISAWDGEKLVGVVRVITDKLAHGLIYGLCVLPEYFEGGLPKELIEKCIAIYPNIHWSVVAEDWEKKYFENLGFQESQNTYLEKGDCPI